MGPALAALIATCAPQVHPVTMHALIAVESARNPYAVSINRPLSHRRSGATLPQFPQPKSADEAVRLTHALHARGFTTSVGLAQINTEHLPRLNRPLTDLFDPCTSLSLAQTILLACDASTAPGPDRLARILSCYHAGDPETGIRNGYVTRIRLAALNTATGDRR